MQVREIAPRWRLPAWEPGRVWRRYGVLLGLLLLLVQGSWHAPAWAGMVGFPAARLAPWHGRLELAGDSFQEDVENTGEAKAKSGRALVTLAWGLTKWSEVFARVGTAEFRVDEALFNGNFGLAFGGGLRVRLLRFPVGMLGLTGQYLRFTSDDDDSAGARVEGAWEEFDVALGLGSRRFGAFAFYAGGLFHRSTITLKNRTAGTQTDLESSTPFRLLLGVHIFPLTDFPLGRFVVNIEARLIGEIPQFTLGLQYAF